MNLLPRHDFSPLENAALLSYADLSNTDSFYCMIFLKLTFVKITADLIKN